jgi:hypothetical protein
MSEKKTTPRRPEVMAFFITNIKKLHCNGRRGVIFFQHKVKTKIIQRRADIK